jgi:polyhydroxybutyrate depolymerase
MKRTVLVALSLLLLSGLTAAQDGSLRERLRARRAERQQTAASAADASVPIAKPGDYSFTLQHDGLERAYKVHVPEGYDPSSPAPLLIAMHGGGGDMNYQSNDTYYGLISKSDREGFVAAFPNGFSRLPGGKLATWNAGKCCGAARDRKVDDVGFIRAMVVRIEAQLNIDAQKVFATGMSNGGMMSHRLACEMPDVVKAIAPVAGTDNTVSCQPLRPVSVLMVHAKNDDHVLFGGGAGAPIKGSAVNDFTSVPATVARWVQRNGCEAMPKRVLEKPGAYCERYAPCRDGTVVQLCVTDTGGHSWPGGTKPRGTEAPSTAIVANDVMWDFFMGR